MEGELAGGGIDDPALQRVGGDQRAVSGFEVGNLEERGVAGGGKQVFVVRLVVYVSNCLTPIWYT